MRDIENYTENYLKPGFEDYQVMYRRKKVLEIIEKVRPGKILEIGCGMEPLFTYLKEYSYDKYVIVEPSQEFYNNACKLSEDIDEVICINDFFTDKIKETTVCDFDMIICSSLLHEISNPEKMLSDIKSICSEKTIVHINVPNANSFHRMLAKCMGIIKDEHEMTNRNIVLQQNMVFDKKMLESFVEKVGFNVLESGTYFIKPFSHDQMYKMMEAGIINEAVLDGLYNMEKVMPDAGSECFVNCVK